MTSFGTFQENYEKMWKSEISLAICFLIAYYNFKIAGKEVIDFHQDDLDELRYFLHKSDDFNHKSQYEQKIGALITHLGMDKIFKLINEFQQEKVKTGDYLDNLYF